MTDDSDPKVIPITRAAARAFMRLPPEERMRILMALVAVRCSVGEEKRPAAEPPAKEPQSE